MSEPGKRPSPVRFFTVVATVANLLTGCAAAPPKVQNSPTAAYRTHLDEFSKTMLDLGAPAVLIEARINGENFSSAAGVRRVDVRTPAEPTDPVHIASVTKSMVAVSVLKLVEDGLIQLDDPVTKHLPEFDSLVKPPGPVTVAQLLRHESGMPSYNEELFSSRPIRQALTQQMTPSASLALTTKMPWVLTPGSGAEYSNSNYLALGLILERARGRQLAEILRTEVFEPLGMTGTHMMGVGAPPSTMVHGHVTVDGERLDSAYLGAMTGNAAGGVVSTVQDVNTFFAALLEGRLLKPATVKAMQQAPFGFFGMGLLRWQDACLGGDFYYGHGGEWAGYRTIVMASTDATRQVAITITHPPETWNPTAYNPDNPFGPEALTRTARTALDVSC